jgi:hypothetical protein
MVEYISLNQVAQKYGQKNLLISEVEILTLLKAHQNYKKLRKKELTLKTKLKSLILQIKKELTHLHHSIPKVKYKKIISKTSKLKSYKTSKKRLSLEKEIIEIKGKIASLTEQ